MMKRALSLLLAIVMVLGLVPMAAFADGEPTISFETTFEDSMIVGDTFTVTASLANNPGVASMTVSLKWNDEAVNFTGFETAYDEELGEDALVTDVFKSVWEPVVNHELGIITAARTKDTKKSGTLFVANFEITGSGELGIGLKDTDISEFQMKPAEGENLAVTFDYSAIAGLSVAAPSTGGATIPAGAPFTAITTDAGDVISIKQMDDVDYTGYSTYKGNPYYHVQIPEGAEEVYVTHPASADPFCDSSYGSAYGYYADTKTWTGGGFNFDFEAAGNGYIITMPLEATINDWTAGDVDVCFVADEEGYVSHAIAVEATTNYKPICFFTFEYGTASGGESDGEEETTYPITVNQTTGGTVTVYSQSMEEITKAAAGEYIFVDAVAHEGYSFKHYLINGVVVTPGELGMNNGFYTMPAAAVTISAVFEQDHSCTYSEEVVDAKYLKSEATCLSGAVYYKSCTCGGEVDKSETAPTFVSGDPVACVYVDSVCQWCRNAEPVSNPGYRFATSADISAENGGTAVVHVKITGHSNPNIVKYNAYDITLSYDSEKLEYQGYDGAVKSDNGQVEVDAENGTIRIVGCGADKVFDTEIAALTFKTKAEGVANVTLNKVQVSDKEESVKENVPVAIPQHKADDTTGDTTPEESIIVVPYTVTKPGFISGADKILHGETYTFSYTDTTNYTYADLAVTVGGVAVENLTADENGVYTIANVTGAVVITATQTPKSYEVSKPENVTGPDNATYGTDYIFTVTPSEGMQISGVTVKDAAGEDVSYTINENGQYVIAGTNITGAFTITITETVKMTTVTFFGIEAAEVEGGLTQAAEIGKAFIFKLVKEEDYAYTVKVGETELTEVEGAYNIPANLVVQGGVTVTVEKVDISTATVDVTEYINLDGKTMFLVTAKWKNKVLAYGEGNTMFWSDKYTVTGEEEPGAYCWLLLSTEEMNTAELVKAAAGAAIVEAAEGATATEVGYNFDINGTTKVDVNDAQLAYDMYNASYMEFTEELPMLKFLEADVTMDSKLDVNDVAAVINYIIRNTVA